VVSVDLAWRVRIAVLRLVVAVCQSAGMTLVMFEQGAAARKLVVGCHDGCSDSSAHDAVLVEDVVPGTRGPDRIDEGVQDPSTAYR
jgi:hypothetical protein